MLEIRLKMHFDRILCLTKENRKIMHEVNLIIIPFA